MDNSQYIKKDVFTIEYGMIYKFTVQGGYEIEGTVVDVFENGIELANGVRLVQSHILWFQPLR